MVRLTSLVFLSVLAAAFSLSAGRTLETSGRAVWEDPNACFNSSGAVPIPNEAVNEAYPVKSVIDCLKSLKVDRDFAMESIQAYSDIFDLGYGYYDFDNNVLDSLPLQNPLNWEIFNGSSGGQVNYKRSFSYLKQMAKRNNGTTGLLSYQIADVILRARDRHTAPTGAIFDNIFLYQENDGPNAWLSLRKDGSEVNVVGNVMDDSTGDVIETKIVSSINNIKPLHYLKSLTLKTGIGKPCQFRSPGVRMNVFLNNMITSPGKFRYQASGVGDIRKLPECLMISYEDQSTDKWCFYLPVPYETYAARPFSAIQESLNTPVGGDAGPKSLFDKLLKRGPLPSSLRSPNFVSPREYLIEAGSVTATNPVGFTVFLDTIQNEFFSGYAVVNGTMVWKLPTFSEPSDIQIDVINFWNAMVEEAEKQNIKKLIIDISENGGGALTNMYTAVQLLYPDVALDDIVHWFTGRISKPMQFLGDDILPYFEKLTSAMLEKENILALVDGINMVEDSERSKAFSRIKNLVEISLALATSVGDGNSQCSGINCLQNGGSNDNWVYLDRARFANLVQAGQNLDENWTKYDDYDSILEDLFEHIQGSIARATSCPNVGDECKVYKKLEGGVNATVSAYQKSDSYLKADYDFTKNNGKRAPFESYVIYSNAGVVGSAANMFESAIRGISKKYEGKVPRAVGVTSGCTGNPEECPMSSFTGQIANSASFVGSFYAMYGVASVFEEILDLIPDDVLDPLKGVDKKVVAEYMANMRSFAKKLPSPPEMALNLPQYNAKRIYNPTITRNTIPMEFWNIPPDEYIAVWPEPGTLAITNQKSLPDIYSRLMAFF